MSDYIYPETFGAIAYATRTLAIAGTDSGAALEDAIDAAAAAGGAIYLTGWYRSARAFLIPNTNTQEAMGTQGPIRLTGIGGHQTAQSVRPEQGAGIVWTAEAGDAVGKIDTRGQGILVLDNIVLASAEGSGNVKPFVHTTFTAIQTGPGFALDGAVYAGENDDEPPYAAIEDGFILGGTVAFEDDPEFDRRSAECGFQGYGTVIENVFCNGIRRLALLQRYANAIRIKNNNIWKSCGNASETGAAIEVNGAPGGGTELAVGNTIADNLIEIRHYKYGVHLAFAFQNKVIGNDGFDAGSDPEAPIVTLAMVRVEDSCSSIIVTAGLGPKAIDMGAGLVDRPYLIGPGDVCVALLSNASEASQLRALHAGGDLLPNIFGTTDFNGPSSLETIRIQPEADGTDASYILHAKRAAGEASNPGATIYAREYGGGVIAGGNRAGNLRNLNPVGASRWDQGRSWGFDRADAVPERRVGANMKQDSGTGGSYFDTYNYAVRFFGHNGTTLGGTLFGSTGWLEMAVGLRIDGNQVVTYRGAAVAGPSGGSVVDTECRAALAALLARLRASTGHGLIAG